jgi:hypothetical protein
MKSLKRKKPAPGPVGKGGAKKAKLATASPVKATAAQKAFDSAATSISLEHLVDRPYVQYNPDEDDICISLSDQLLTVSLSDSGM